eukprot:scaffold16386_cov111-Phaeocystis_antarctica.AAC.1
MDVWTPPQERRGLCQEPDTALGFEPKISAARCGILSVSVGDFCSKARTKPRLLNPTTRPQGPDGSTDLESRSTTSFLGRAWLTATRHPCARAKSSARRPECRKFGFEPPFCAAFHSWSHDDELCIKHASRRNFAYDGFYGPRAMFNGPADEHDGGIRRSYAGAVSAL